MHGIHAIIVMGGSIVHPSWVESGCRMAYLCSFQRVALTWNLSLQFVSLNICTLRFGLGVKGWSNYRWAS